MRLKPFLRITADFLIWARLKENVYPSQSIWQSIYMDLNDCIANNKKLQPGDKVYANCMGKAIALFLIGKKPIEQGMNILGAHIDSPRIDVKQNPCMMIPSSYY